MREATDFDVGIIGGGPAGAAMGAYLAKAGVTCVIFEREIFPREHVGESLVPSSTRVFRDLEFLGVMESSHFPHKRGAVWTASTTTRRFEHEWEGLIADYYAELEFGERRQQGVDMDYTYHVDRGVFDLALLQHAHALGAKVYEGVRVDGADLSEAGGVDVRYRIGRRECATRVGMVVDASGRNTLIGNQQGWKVADPVFDQYAIHTWFDNYDRSIVAQGDAKLDHIYVHFLPITNSWVWQIPISATTTSIGVVTQKKHFKASRASREEFFWDCVSSRPEFIEALRHATQMRPLKAEGDYSYAMRKIVDDRLMLIGDAGRFVDPIFSTGVSIALTSARFGHADIVRAVETGDFGAAGFRTFEDTIRRGTTNWHEFISVYYRLNILFTAFVNDPRYRLDVLKLLQGDVYDEAAPEVLTRMKEVVSAVERNDDHVWHGLLNDLTANAFAPSF